VGYVLVPRHEDMVTIGQYLLVLDFLVYEIIIIENLGLSDGYFARLQWKNLYQSTNLRTTTRDNKLYLQLSRL